MQELKHMDIGSRNARLRETLEGMGLFVTPIFLKDRPDQIDYIHVSVGPPSYSGGCQSCGQSTASGAVPLPMASSKVIESVGAANGEGDNVIYLPPVG
jgi:hypothetical protein